MNEPECLKKADSVTGGGDPKCSGSKLLGLILGFRNAGMLKVSCKDCGKPASVPLSFHRTDHAKGGTRQLSTSASLCCSIGCALKRTGAVRRLLLRTVATVVPASHLESWRRGWCVSGTHDGQASSGRNHIRSGLSPVGIEAVAVQRTSIHSSSTSVTQRQRWTTFLLMVVPCHGEISCTSSAWLQTDGNIQRQAMTRHLRQTEDCHISA